MLTSGNAFEYRNLDCFMYIFDDQWIRATDFTPSCYIGQSSALCLELPSDHQLPNFWENFAYYKESEERYILETIVGPPPGITLPYGLLRLVFLPIWIWCLLLALRLGLLYHLISCLKLTRWFKMAVSQDQHLMQVFIAWLIQ